MASNAPRFDLPTIEAETKPFWDALKDGKLLIGECGGCGKVHYYPRAMCPYCWSDDVTMVPAKGTGVLYTWSTVHVNDLPPFKGMVPYVAAQVDLDEGVRMIANIIETDAADIKPGARVEVAWDKITDDFVYPAFRVVEG